MAQAPALPEVETFARDGFVILRNVLSPAELEALRAETQAQIDAGPAREPRTDFISRKLPDGNERFFRIQNLTSKSLVNESLLQSIAQPRILDVVAGILGPDWTTYGTAMVFKGSGGGPVISLHRDTFLDRSHSPEHHSFNVDIYLDAATPETGCLRVVPGSHKLADVKPVIEAGLDHPDLVDVPMQPGDVLFHDVLLLHGSRPTVAGSPLRRVIYNSYQSAGWMEREGVLPTLDVSRRWIAQNIKLIQHAIARRRANPALAGETQFDYAVPDEWRAAVDAVELDLRPEEDLPWFKPGFMG